jgi:tetratricopeptide (TPR) repeat protein/outer membrane protein assembly factor BamB
MMVGALLWGIPSNASADWSVTGGARRHLIVLKRFQSIAERNPVRGFAYSRMFKLARRSPGLVRFIRSYERRIRKKPSRLNLRLLLGHLYADTGQKSKAILQYKAVLRLKPKHRSAYLYIARLQQKLNQPQQALNAYKSALVNARSSSVKRKCLKAMGALSLVLKKPKQALAYWAEYLKKSPRNTAAREEIARSLVRYKLYVEARGQLAIVLKRTRSAARRARLYRKIGDIFEQEDKWKLAVAYYRKAMKKTRRGHWLRRELSERILQIHREKGELKALVKHLEKNKKKSRSELAQIARLYDEIGNNKAAQKAYRAALKAKPRNTRLRLKYITLLEVMDNDKEAVRQYRILIKYEPREPRYRLSFVELLSRLGRRRESLKEMKTLTRVFSRKSEVLSRIAQLYRRRRMDQEAIQLYKRLMVIEPREASHIQALGDYYYSLNKWKKAYATWKKVWGRVSPRHRAASILGQIYRDHSQMNKARKWFRKAVSLKPKKRQYLTQLGDLYQRILDLDGSLSANNLKDAIKVWKKLVKMARNRRERRRARFQLFAFYYAEGSAYRLPEKYQQRLLKNPRDIEAMRFLGEYALWRSQKLGRRTLYRARSYYQRILRVKPADVDALLTLEQMEARKSRWSKARAYLLRVVKTRKRANRADYRRLVGYAMKMRDYSMAIRYGRRVVTLFPSDASAHAEMARIYARAGQRQKAITSYREAIRLRPKNYPYLQALADIHYKDGQLQKAAVLYRKVLKNARDSRVIFEAAQRTMEILMSNQREIRRLEGQLQSLAETRPRELAYFRALAELYRRQGRMKEYQNAYLKAAATVDNKAQVYRTLAEVAQEQGHIRKAIIYYRKMLEESNNPTTSEQLHLAKLHFQVNQKQAARKILAALLNENPNSLRVMREIADLLYNNQMTKQAIKAYESYLELDPSESMIRLRLGRLYKNAGQKEAALGLFASIVWDNQERPLLSRRKKKKKSKKKLPYYLRRRSYYARRRKLNQARGAALSELLKIHETQKTLDRFERRALSLLRDYSIYNRLGLLYQIEKIYVKRKWYNRLKRILEEAYRRNPNNSRWVMRLAAVYQVQKKYAEAFRLYTRVERLNTRWRHLFIKQKIELLLAMKNDARLKLTLMEYLRSQPSFNYYRFRSLLQTLKNRKKYKMATMILRWGVKYGTPRYRPALLRELVSLQLLRGYQGEGRKLLLRAWLRETDYTSRSASRIYYLRNRRRQLLNRLWPLLDKNAQRTLLQTAERKVFLLSLEKPGHKKTLSRLKLKRALIDAYLLTEKIKGNKAAQVYLPSLWSASTYYDRSFRQNLPLKLLREKKYDVALLILREQIKAKKYGIAKLKALYLLFGKLRSIPQPSRAVTRFLEQEMIAIRNQVKPAPWQWVVLQLSSLYLRWGAYKRVIWWVERCRWIGGEKLRRDSEMLMHLARAYKRQGKTTIARRYYRGILAKEWKAFVKDPDQERVRAKRNVLMRYMVLYPTRYPRYMRYYKRRSRYSRLYRLRRLMRRYRYSARYRSRIRRILARLRRRRFGRYAGMPGLYNAQRQLRRLYQLFEEAERLPLLRKRLKARVTKSRMPRAKRQALMTQAAFLSMHWKRTRDTKTLRALFQCLLALERRLPTTRARVFALLRGTLYTQNGDYKKALRVYKAILSRTNRKARAPLLRLLSRLYGKLNQPAQQRKLNLELSNLHRDQQANVWLARYHRGRREYSEAIRYYRLYLRKAYKRTNTYYRAYREIQVARFLLEVDERSRSIYFLQRTLGHLRQGWSGSGYRLSKMSLLKQAVGLYRQAGRLSEMVLSWERRHQAQARNEFWMLLLQHSYGLQSKDAKKHAILKKLVTLKPSDNSNLKALISSCHTKTCFRALLPFLNKTVKGKSSRHRWFNSWMADVYQVLGRDKEAKKSLQAQFDSFGKSRYYLRSYGFKVGIHALKMGYRKLALKLFQDMLRVSTANSYNYYWPNAISAVRALLEKRATKETVVFIKAVLQLRGRTPYDTERVSYILMLADAYKMLGQTAKAEREMATLEKAYITSYNNHFLVASSFERHGRLLQAEVSYWSALRSSVRNGRLRSRYLESLCRLWKAQKLGQLCNLTRLDMDLSINSRSSLRLATLLEKKKLGMLALASLRLAWLNDPRNHALLKAQAALAARLGRAQQAKKLAALYKRWSGKSLRLNIGAAKSANSRQQWALQVPSWCPSLRIVGGRLDTSSCLQHRHWLRCPRRVALSNGRVFVNSCSGQIVAFDAASGKALWIHQLPALKRSTYRRRDLCVVDTSRDPKQVVRRFYSLRSLRVHKGTLYLAANENRLEVADSSASGIRHRLHLRALSVSSGQALWKRSLLSHYVSQKSGFSGDLLGFFSRRFQTVSLKNGAKQWVSGQGRLSSPWLWGGNHRLAFTAVNNGFVLSNVSRTLTHLDRKGNVVWQRTLPWKTYSLTSNETMVFALTHGAVLVALDLKTGRVRWKKKVQVSTESRQLHLWYGYFYQFVRGATLQYFNGSLLLSGTDGYLSSYRASTGKLRWKRQLGEYTVRNMAVDRDRNEVGLVTVQGTVFVVNASNGSVRWSYGLGYLYPPFYPSMQQRAPYLRGRLIQSSYRSGYPYRGTRMSGSTGVVWSGKTLWLGHYNRKGHFWLRAFKRQSQPNYKTAMAQLQKMRKARWTRGIRKQLKVLMLDIHDSQNKALLLSLAQRETIHPLLRMRMILAYFRHSTSLNKAFKEGRTTFLNIAQRFANQSSQLLTLSRRDSFLLLTLYALLSRGTRSWKPVQRFKAMLTKALNNTRGLPYHTWDSGLLRRVLTWGARSTRGVRQENAVLWLAVLRDDSARQQLLQRLVKRTKVAGVPLKKTQLNRISMLIRWNKYFEWKGLALQRDAAQISRLLRSPYKEVRVRAALFLGDLASTYARYRRYNTPEVRGLLLKGIQTTLSTEQSGLAAILLGRLGERRGILLLRALFRRTKGYFQTRVATYLADDFSDFTGMPHLVARRQRQRLNNPKLPSFRIIAANLFSAAGLYQKALREFKSVEEMSASALNPSHLHMSYLGRGRTYYRMKKYAKALAMFRKARKADKEHSMTLVWLSAALVQRKQYAKAIRLLERTAQNNPDVKMESSWVYLLGRSYALQGKMDAVDQLFRKAHRQMPLSSRLYYHRARIWMALATPNTDKALASINKALAMSGGMPMYLSLKATILHKAGKPEKARLLLQKSIQGRSLHSPMYKKDRARYEKWFPNQPLSMTKP